jgi:cytochrome bd-type quinol oxidase subunit 1
MSSLTAARLGLAIAMAIGGVAAVTQPILGDALAKRAHVQQPAKLAAMEGQFVTERGAPLSRLFGSCLGFSRSARCRFSVRKWAGTAAGNRGAAVSALERT